ncbi:MBL fold metallo-hydrolase [Microvirga sp. HBU67558]|uniref:MBL fold metallo-hydrolase n=1 Tax=Microvirga TaxID=186650 RepID=UPI001B36097A|nr:MULTISPECIES: MBL fold metallo-hydrolase [unclassified Microvirga]MBQ0824712.1 MBL fold metallo-hydrolase [Microvirga sp. HBU67558]
MSTAAYPQAGPDRSAGPPQVEAFFDQRTCSIQYIVADPATGRCALVDPVLDYDEKSGSIATASADALLAHVSEKGLTVDWILDTHPHADHMSAAGYLKDRTGARTAIGERIVNVQRLWKEIYNLKEFAADGSQWDRLLADDEVFQIGDMDARVMFSPGHTLASITYVVGDAAFIHDTLFMPDFGTARCDFPGGDARALWHTIRRILSLPDETRLFSGHDYSPGGRDPAWESTVASQKASNIHLVRARTEDAFIAMRQARDAKLPMPKLILHALQVNMAGGRLPAPESNGMRYLKIPLDGLADAVWE